MTVTDQIKILDNKIKSNQAQYDLGRQATRIYALSSKNVLDKYENLTGEDLGYKPNVFKRAKFEYSPLGMLLSKAFKKDEAKSVAKNKSDFNQDSNYTFYRFYKGYDEFEEISLDSKCNRIKEFNKILISFKAVETKKTETQLKKERIMKNVDELCKKYYNAYESDYGTDDKLNETKKKILDYKQFKLGDKTDEELKLDEETKDLKLTALPKWLSSKNDFNEAAKLINDNRSRTNKVKPGSGNKKVFNELNRLINDISNNKVKKESTTKRMKKKYI